IPGDSRLVAYIVLRDLQSMLPEELRRFLKEKLPEYMVPSQFVFLPALPLTPNGKVDRKALPKPEQPKASSPVSHHVSDDVELRLIKIWGSVLGIRDIHTNDNFFDLG